MADRDEEQAWVEQSRQGDFDAFENLVRRYQRMIYSLTFRMTGSAADAEDLAQETFIQAFQHLHSYRSEARFASWLYRIAVNQCLNWKKRDLRRTEIHKEWGRRIADTDPRDESVSHHVQEALLKLPPKQRAAVVLTTYEGLSHAEAARVLKCSEATVSWRVFAARMKLKKLLRALNQSSCYERCRSRQAAEIRSPYGTG